MSMPSLRRSFFGPRIVAAAFVAQFVSNASTLAPAGMFLTSLEAEFDTDAATLSHGVGAAILLMGLMSPLVGRWIDRGPQRAIMMGGACTLAAGLALASWAQSLWQLALAFCLVANLGYMLVGPLPSVTLVSRWYVRHRGLAVAIAVAGATLASALAPWLAARWIEAWGWRNAMFGFAVAAAGLALPAFALWVVGRPEDVGQHADGEARPALEPEIEDEGSLANTLLRQRNFHLVAFGLALLFTSPIITTVHLAPYAEKELGLGKVEIAPFFVVLAIFSLVGKLVFGAVADRVDPRHALAGTTLGTAVGWIFLMQDPGYGGFVALAALFGLGIGAAAPLQAVVLGRCFGRNAFGQVMGLSGLIGLPFIAGANPVAGGLFVRTGSYASAFGLEAAALLVASLLFMLIRLPGVPAVLSVAPEAESHA